MRKIANLTQRFATDAQIAAGVIEPPPDWKKQIDKLLTFDKLPRFQEIVDRANMIADYARRMECECAMIDGPPYLMGPLEFALISLSIAPMYAFTEAGQLTQQRNGRASSSQAVMHVGFVVVIDPGELGLKEDHETTT